MGTTSGTSEARPAARNWAAVGRASFGHCSRCACQKTTTMRQRAVTAAGRKPPRKMPTTEVSVTCPSTIMKMAGGTRMPMALAEATRETACSRL